MAISLRLLELNGKDTVLCSRLSETVADVKIAIERMNHVSRHDQRLLLGERQLSDDEVLLKLHIMLSYDPRRRHGFSFGVFP